MKKITFLLCMLIAFSSAQAANGIKAPGIKSSEMHGKSILKNSSHESGDFKNTHVNKGTAVNQNRVAQVPFFSEVFAGGLPPTWQNIDSSGSGVVWSWTTTGSAFSYPGIDSLSAVGTSAANGYMKFDSDSAGGTIQGEYGVLITDAIDCSLHSTVRLTFNEFFVIYNGTTPIYPNTGRVYISTDGTNWTLIHAADAGLSLNYESTNNPNAVSLDVSSIAAGQSTVYLKFSYAGDFSLFWFIDDLQLSEVDALDAGLFGILDPFNACSLSSAEDIIIGVYNNGLDSLTNIPVYYSINGGTAVAEIITDTLAPGDSLAYLFTTPADLSAAGSYNITSYVAFPGDLTSSNDTVAISTTSYAPNTPVYTMGFEASDDFSGYTVNDVDGDGYDVYLTNATAHSGSVSMVFDWPTSATADNWLFTNCFDLQSTDVYNLDLWLQQVEVTSSFINYDFEAYIGTSTDISSMNLIFSVPPATDSLWHEVNSNFTVPSSGTYFIGFRTYGNFVTSPTLIDDITVDFASGIKNLISNDAVSVFPNPSKGKIFIVNKGLKDASASIQVLNTVGQVVSSINVQNFVNETIDLSNQPDGLYNVRIQTASGVITKTVMVSSK